MKYQHTIHGEFNPNLNLKRLKITDRMGKQEATNSKDEHTPRNVEVVDVSDDDGEQDPPPPNKPKVVHESSDDENLGT